MSCVLQTSRLQLRPCEIEDIQIVHTLWTNDRVRSFLFDKRVISSDEARSLVNSEQYVLDIGTGTGHLAIADSLAQYPKMPDPLFVASKVPS